METLNYIDRTLLKFSKPIFQKIKDGWNKSSDFDFKYLFHYSDNVQLSQICGIRLEANIRGILTEDYDTITVSGNPKDINEDDNLILDHRWADHEVKFTRREYTSTGEVLKPHWWTNRNGKCGRKRNFIFVEGEYDDYKNVFVFHKIYVSFQRISYNDIKSNNITEDFVKENSFLITLH